MEIKGEYRIAAARDKVFAALNDPAILQACIPGCELLEKTSDTEMKARVRLRIGPVSATFGGKVTLSDIDPPNGYKISGEWQGGAAGFAKGGAVVKLGDDAGTTVLTYDVDAQVGGKIAQVGARLIDGTAKKLADEFFGKFATVVGAPATEAGGDGNGLGATSSAVTAQSPPPSSAAQRGYRHWLIIALGAAVLIAIFLLRR